MRKAFQRIRDNETGHISVGVPSLVATIGAIVLGYGAAGDSDVAAITGGFGLGLGILVASFARHRAIDWDVWRRLDELEKK
jgi:hypothetical protein